MVGKKGSSVDQLSNRKLGRHVTVVVYKASWEKRGSSVDLSSNNELGHHVI